MVSGALAAFALGGGPQAVVDITYGGPRKLCAVCSTLPLDQNVIAWINLDTLEKTLPAQGVKVIRQQMQTVLEFPGITQNVRLPLSDWFSSRHQRYTPIWQLIWGLMSTNQAQISGFDNPTLTVGDIKLGLGNKKEVLSGYTAYEPLVGQAVSKFMRESRASSVDQPADLSFKLVSRAADGMPVENDSMHAHRIETSANPGDVVVLLTRTASGVLFYDFAPVGQDRSVKVYLERPNLRFVSNAAELSPYLRGNRANAVLLKLNGKMSTLMNDNMAEVIQPLSPTSDAQ